MRLLIVGGCGFIGEFLSPWLADIGHQVIVADWECRIGRLSSRVGLDLQARNLTEVTPDDRIFENVDQVIHLSSSSSPASSMKNFEKDANDNILSALRILEGCRIHGIGTFIFASSGGTVYGETMQSVVTETHETNPINAYGVGKLTIEKYMRLFAHHSGMQTISLRMANAYGPGQLRGRSVGAIANFVLKAHHGKPIEIWGDGETVRDYVYISDIATAFGSCVSSPDLPSGEYNVSSGIGHSLRQVIAELGAVIGKRPVARYLAARPVDVPRIVLDSSKLRNATGWKPQVELSEGIRLLYQQVESAHSV